MDPKSFSLFYLENTGVSEIWETIKSYNEHITSSNWKVENRKQLMYWLHQSIKEELGKKKYNSLSTKQIKKLEEMLSNGKTIYQIIEGIQ